jgi:hypothetical protein
MSCLLLGIFLAPQVMNVCKTMLSPDRLASLSNLAVPVRCIGILPYPWISSFDRICFFEGKLCLPNCNALPVQYFYCRVLARSLCFQIAGLLPSYLEYCP